MKNHRILYKLLLFPLLVFSQNLRAHVLHWPELCHTAELKITNPTAQTQPIWLQKFRQTLISETEYEIPARTTSSVPVEKITAADRHSLLTSNSKLEVTYSCNGLTYPVNALEGGVLTFKIKGENELWLQNLYTDANTVRIEHEKSSEEIVLASLESRRVALSAGSFVKVSATNKISAFILSPNGAEAPAKVEPRTSDVDSAGVYFSVGPRTGDGDTFTVQIRNPALFAKARDLIAHPQKEKMLFARIQKNHQGVNRNWNSSEKNFWSWSASEVTNLSDLGSTSCNGTPQAVEDRMDYWVDDPGFICFWNYRVKRELSPAEVSTGVLSKK